MNKYIILCLFTLFLSIACNTDDIELETSATTLTKPMDDAKSALIVDGEPIFAGMGYSALEDRFFLPAIDSYDVLRDTNLPNPLEIEIETITNEEDLDKYFREERTFELSVLFGLFRRSERRKLSESITMDENHVSVIVSIKVQTARYVVAGAPFLDNDAQDLLNLGLTDSFFKRHGPTYVSENIIGGEVYYVYTYDVSGLTREKKSSFRRNIRSNFEELFGLTPRRILSNKERQEISRSEESVQIETSIVGFSPSAIRNEADVAAQVTAIQNYLDVNPQNAASVSMKLNSYDQVLDDNRFTNAYRRAAYFFGNWSDWSERYSEAEVINNYLLANSLDASVSSSLLDQIQLQVDYALNESSNSFPIGLGFPVDNIVANLNNLRNSICTNGCPWDFQESSPDYISDEEIVMRKGQTFTTPDGSHRLRFQENGTLVLYNNSDEYIWFNSGENTGEVLLLKDDGNMVLNNIRGNAIWQTNTNISNSTWSFEDDGNLVLRAPNGNITWSTSGKGAQNGTSVILRKGDELIADNGVRLTLANNGVLVLYDASDQIIWFNSGSNTGETLQMGTNTNGKLELKDNNGNTIWSPVNSPTGSYWEFDKTSGDLIVRGPDNSLLWSIYNR